MIDPSEVPFGQGWTGVGMLVRYFVAVGIMIALMRLWYYSLGEDPLAYPLIHGDLVSIDLWSFVHVLIYMGVGFVLPNHMLVSFIGGCFFEVFEGYCADTPITHLRSFWQERGVNSAWDIFFNTLGFRLGQGLLVTYVVMRRKQKGTATSKKRYS